VHTRLCLYFKLFRRLVEWQLLPQNGRAGEGDGLLLLLPLLREAYEPGVAAQLRAQQAEQDAGKDGRGQGSTQQRILVRARAAVLARLDSVGGIVLLLGTVLFAFLVGGSFVDVGLSAAGVEAANWACSGAFLLEVRSLLATY